MSGTAYTIAAYTIGLGLMLLYGLILWTQARAVRRRRQDEGEK